MGWLFVRHRLGPGYYLFARFWRPELRFADKAAHWNGRRYLRHIHRLNDPAYYKISQNKLSEKSLLSTLGMPTAPLVGFFHPLRGQDPSGRPLRSAADLMSLAATQQGRWFLKPIEGDSGRGATAVAIVHDGDVVGLRHPITGDVVDPQALGDMMSREPAGYIIERFIEQHPELMRVNPSSVNTLRMWVVAHAEGSRVVGAFLRVGRAGSLVDNTAQGGLSCAIDLDTGRIRQALDQSPWRREHVRHPDTGATLVGTAIPHWAECVAVAQRAVTLLPGARFAGMDIAVANDGPRVVEYNVEPSYQGAAQFDVPHSRIFAATLSSHQVP